MAPAAWAALLSELGRLLSGGVLQVYNGGTPARAGETPQTATLLVELPIRSFSLTSGGMLLDVGSGPGQATAKPAWFQIRAPGGTVMQDGEVGSGPNQLRVEPESIIRGGRVDAQTITVAWET